MPRILKWQGVGEGRGIDEAKSLRLYLVRKGYVCLEPVTRHHTRMDKALYVDSGLKGKELIGR